MLLPPSSPSHQAGPAWSPGRSTGGAGLSAGAMTEELSTKPNPQQFFLPPPAKETQKRNTPQIPLFGMEKGSNGENRCQAAGLRESPQAGTAATGGAGPPQPRLDCSCSEICIKEVFSKPGCWFVFFSFPYQNTHSRWKCSLTSLLE